MASELGIVKEDFENNAFADFSRELVRIPVTKTISNISGTPTYTRGTNETFYGIFTKRTNRYDYSKEGLTEMGDAFLQIKQDQEMNKEDLILVDSEYFRVDTIIMRKPAGENHFKSVILFLVE
jgi:hypothetical protein